MDRSYDRGFRIKVVFGVMPAERIETAPWIWEELRATNPKWCRAALATALQSGEVT